MMRNLLSRIFGPSKSDLCRVIFEQERRLKELEFLLRENEDE